MSSRHNVFCSVSLIFLAVLAMLMPGSAVLAQEVEQTAHSKETTIPLSIAVPIASPTQDSFAVKYGVNTDKVRKEGEYNYHYLIGWVFVENQEARGQKVYVEYEKPDGSFVHYSTMPEERTDVGANYKNALYNASGFNAKIKLKNESDIDACMIRFVVKNKSGIFKSSVWKAGVQFSARGELAPLRSESQEVKYCLGANEERKAGKISYLLMSGWVYVNDQETRGQQVYIQLERPDGKIVHYSTVPIERPDIGAYYKNALYIASGFLAFIPPNDEKAIRECTIRFVVRNKNGIYKSPVAKAGIKVSSRVELVLPESESRAISFYISANEVWKAGKYSYQYLSGWIYIKGQETRGQEVYVQLEKPDGMVEHYSTIPIERLDVGTGFKNPLYNASGFSASIPLKDGLDIDACTIRLVVKNKNGIYKSPVWKAGIRVGSPAGKMSFFVLVNWILVIVTSIVLLVAIWADRSLLIKPSIMVILFFHVMCQWGTALQAGRIEQFLPKPWVFVLLSHGFPIIGLAVSLLIWRRSARAIWGRIIDHKPAELSRKNKALLLLAIFFILFIFLYLSHVPFRTTGLYKVFSSPLESSAARDQSVKFLANPFLRYGYSIVMAVFAPLLAVLTMQVLLWQIRQRKWLLAILYLIFLVCVFVASSLSGARAYPAFIILVIVFALLLRKGFPLNPLYLAVGILLILTFPTMLTLLREGKAITAKSFIEYFRGSTYQRVLIIPMETGVLHVHYAQTHGFFGIQAMPKLAAIKGIEPLNVPNFIAKIYGGNPLDTTTANTAYIYAYYSYFGLIAFIPCLIGLWLLDLSLLVYRKLSANLLIPCVACISIAANTFSQTEYTISLFSQGFLFLLLVSWAVDRAVIKIESITEKKAN